MSIWDKEYTRALKEIKNLSRIINSNINAKGAQIANKKLQHIQANIDLLTEKAFTKVQQSRIQELQSLYHLTFDAKIKKLLTNDWPKKHITSG